MFLIFVLVILALAIGILSGVSSLFLPFMHQLWTTQDYYQAYYGALSAIERAELSLRYRSPGFEWSWGFLGMTWFGPISDWTSELLSGENQWFWRTIQSRTRSIPSSGMGNVDPLLAAVDSASFNQLGYTNGEIFLLSYDTTPVFKSYYAEDQPLFLYSWGGITWIVRLPPKVHQTFGNTPGLLCDNLEGDMCDPDHDGVYDDPVVSWSLAGLYAETDFEIFPTIAILYYSGMVVDTYHDNALRESLINMTWHIALDAWYTPVANGRWLKYHTVVGAESFAIQGQQFSEILSNLRSQFTDLRFTLGATQLFRTYTGTIYPYLEYQFTFPDWISDRYYTIHGYGRVGEYDVQILLKKPTIQWVAGSDFTVVF